MTNRPLNAIAGGLLLALATGGDACAAAALETAPVTTSTAAGLTGFTAVVEAVRQTALAAQVSGSVLEIHVRPGDAVRAGQVLLRLDAHAADQAATSGDAQVEAARAALAVASRDYERKKQLLDKNYISQAAFDRVKAQYEASQAQVSAQLAQAGVAHVQSGYYAVVAPYAGVVAEVPVTVGDMALPGKLLVSIYDPAALRVTAAVPQGAIAGAAVDGAGVKAEIPGLPAARQWLVPSHVLVLPTVDPQTHTVEVRLDLPRGTAGVAPGMFARAWLPDRPFSAGSAMAGASADAAAPDATRLFVPASAIVRRAEVSALYVVQDGGHPILRQVRLGDRVDGRVEVLSGVSAGERVAVDPQAAARAP